MNKKIELLAPAGSFFKAEIALKYGADAIYLGAKQFSLRARATNFELNDIKKIILLAHNKKKKVYIVTNIFCHNNDLKRLKPFLKKIISFNPDGFICSDPYIICMLYKLSNKVNIHISTQQSVTNSKAALFWKRNNAKRIILAREVSYPELKKILKNINKQMEIECFIHGAICISYSGRCHISNNYCLRDSNIGGCAQSCRWVYKLFDEKKIYSKSFTMSAKDMCQLKNMKKILNLDLTSIKIEGRMKSEYYLANVCNVYKNFINNYYKNGSTNYKKYIDELKKNSNREFCSAWFNGLPNFKSFICSENQLIVNQSYAFIINKYIGKNIYEITSKNYFESSYSFEVLKPKEDPLKFKIIKIFDSEHKNISIVNTPQKIYYIKVKNNINLARNDIVRIRSKY